MLRVNFLKRVATTAAVAGKNTSFLAHSRALSATAADKSVLGLYGITPTADTTVFRNLSYDDIHSRGE